MFDQDKRPGDPHRPRCVVSENFAALYHVAVGDHITIPGRTTPTIDLEIIGTVVDYSYNRGTVLVDYAWYSEEFADHQVDVFDVYLKPGVDAPPGADGADQARRLGRKAGGVRGAARRAARGGDTASSNGSTTSLTLRNSWWAWWRFWAW